MSSKDKNEKRYYHMTPYYYYTGNDDNIISCKCDDILKLQCDNSLLINAQAELYSIKCTYDNITSMYNDIMIKSFMSINMDQDTAADMYQDIIDMENDSKEQIRLYDLKLEETIELNKEEISEYEEVDEEYHSSEE